jgi:hypothetical protein
LKVKYSLFIVGFLLLMAAEIVLPPVQHLIASNFFYDEFLSSKENGTLSTFIYSEAAFKAVVLDKKELQKNGDWYDIVSVKRAGKFYAVLCKNDAAETNYHLSFFKHFHLKRTRHQQHHSFHFFALCGCPTSINSISFFCQSSSVSVFFSEDFFTCQGFTQSVFSPPDFA